MILLNEVEEGEDMSEKRKVIYYRDERNDEFSRAQIIPKKID